MIHHPQQHSSALSARVDGVDAAKATTTGTEKGCVFNTCKGSEKIKKYEVMKITHTHTYIHLYQDVQKVGTWIEQSF